MNKEKPYKTNGIIRVHDYLERAQLLEAEHEKNKDDQKHREFLISQSEYWNERFSKDKDIKKWNFFFYVFTFLSLVLVVFLFIIILWANNLGYNMEELKNFGYVILAYMTLEKSALGIYLGLKYKEKK